MLCVLRRNGVARKITPRLDDNCPVRDFLKSNLVK